VSVTRIFDRLDVTVNDPFLVRVLDGLTDQKRKLQPFPRGRLD